MGCDDLNEFKEQIENGALARVGLLDATTIGAASALLKRVADSDLETVRVLFADQHGILRGKTIVADALPSIFTSGLAAPSTLLLKDTSHRTVFPIWSENPGIDCDSAGNMAGAGDILMLPDPATFRILPWSPHSAWIFCDSQSHTWLSISDRRPLRASRADIRRATPLLSGDEHARQFDGNRNGPKPV